MFEETFRKDGNAELREAEHYFHEAYQFQISGHLNRAVELYRKSIATFPTAEAHTFLGWAYSLMGELERAIEECKAAIRVDPTFGNPYNDIGAYLISLKRIDEAVPWLQKSISAERYDARHYPHFNLGRVMEIRGEWDAALGEYNKALALNPEYQLARDASQRLHSLLARRN